MITHSNKLSTDLSMKRKIEVTVLQVKEVGYPIAMGFGMANRSKLTTHIIFKFLF